MADQDLAADLARINAELEQAKQAAAAAKQAADQSSAYMEEVKRAASGQPAEQPKKPAETFVDNIITQGDRPVRNLVQEELQKQAYFNTLTKNFQEKNKHLVSLQDEVFAKTNQIMQAANAQGQSIDWESALETATKHYDEKAKAMAKVAGANASPAGHYGMPNSRYSGSDVDYFAMSDREFTDTVMKPRDAERKKRNREMLGFYGSGR